MSLESIAEKRLTFNHFPHTPNYLNLTFVGFPFFYEPFPSELEKSISCYKRASLPAPYLLTNNFVGVSVYFRKSHFEERNFEEKCGIVEKEKPGHEAARLEGYKVEVKLCKLYIALT